MDTNTNTPHFPYAVANPPTATLAEHLDYLVSTRGLDPLLPIWREVYAARTTEPLSRAQLREMIAYFD